MSYKESVRIKIYALINPIDGMVFYVGATSQSIDKRLYQHCQETKQMPMKSHRPKHKIIVNLFCLGITPEVIELDEVDLIESTFFEDFYSNLMRSFGFNIKIQKSAFEKLHIAKQKRYDYKRNNKPRIQLIKLSSGKVFEQKIWDTKYK